MQKGWFLAGLLYLHGEPVAFQLGTAYRGTYAASGTAFDPAHSEERPGTYLLMKVIEQLCADPAVDRLDFGFGDADYKRAFADESWVEQDVEVFEPRARRSGSTSLRPRSEARPQRRDPSSTGRGGCETPAESGARGSRPPIGRRSALRRGLRNALLAVGILAVLVVAALGASAALDRPARVMTVTSTIEAPKPEIWAVLTDFDTYDEWNPVFTSASGEAVVGSSLDLELTLPGHDPEELDAEVLVVNGD